MGRSTSGSAPTSPTAISGGEGSLQAYIRAVQRYPLLSSEDEQDLARRKDHDPQAAHALVLSHLRLVASMARTYSGYGLPYGDLIQEGTIGLMKAVERFDPDRGVRLVSYAMHWIRAEMHEYIVRNWRIVRIATTKSQRKLFFNLRSMKPESAELQDQDVKRIAAALNVRASDVRDMDSRFSAGDVSCDASTGQDGQGGMSRLLADEGAEPSLLLETAEAERLGAQGLKKALVGLDQRSRRIIDARWMNDQAVAGGGRTKGKGKVKGKVTLEQLADEFRVSGERIRQIQTQALRQMRDVITGQQVR